MQELIDLKCHGVQDLRWLPSLAFGAWEAMGRRGKEREEEEKGNLFWCSPMAETHRGCRNLVGKRRRRTAQTWVATHRGKQTWVALGVTQGATARRARR